MSNSYDVFKRVLLENDIYDCDTELEYMTAIKIYDSHVKHNEIQDSFEDWIGDYVGYMKMDGY